VEMWLKLIGCKGARKQL